MASMQFAICPPMFLAANKISTSKLRRDSLRNKKMACRPPTLLVATQTHDAGASAGHHFSLENCLREKWWRRRGLNPRPPRCERGALPTELLPHLEGHHSPRFGFHCQNYFSHHVTRRRTQSMCRERNEAQGRTEPGFPSIVNRSVAPFTEHHTGKFPYDIMWISIDMWSSIS